MLARGGVLGLALSVVLCAPVSAATVLFDASKHEMGGNADWVVDADTHDLNLPAYPCTGSTNESNPGRFPTPAQAGITPATPETYWTGGISAWAVDLAKAGHTVETLPPGAQITFGNGANPQDLSLYQLFIVVEPQAPFTAGEKAAILAFVAAGGGLFMVADHETSDRDCDDWDSPHVWNDLTGATSSNAGGAFGIWFRVNGAEDRGSEDWFDDAVDASVVSDPADPILHGPFGSGVGGLGLFGSTSMDLDTIANPTAKGHVFRSGQAPGNVRVTFATASYGAGRVAAIGDSSPADDDTGDPSDSLYPGWDRASGGVANREIHLNACAWLLNPAPDTTPPSITSGPSVSAADCSAVITWSTDEAATSVVEYGLTSGYGSTASASGQSTQHSVALGPVDPATEYHYRVSSTDPSGNGPTTSGDATFSTAPAAPPSIVAGPSVSAISGTSATITWTTDEPASSVVDYGETTGYGSSASGPNGVTAHTVVLTGLTPETSYHARAASSDACGNGPTLSGDLPFTTTQASIDLTGWTLKQYTSTQLYTIPAGTLLPSGGWLVVGRNATRAEFEATYPGMPAATVYLNSNQNGSCASAGCFPQINGDESFELYDASQVLRDGVTVSMATTHQSWQRKNPGDPAGSAASWNVVAESAASPGTGVGVSSGAGVRINEMSDASSFTKEFVELYYDAAPAAPDSAAPGRVVDLAAIPVSSDSVRLDWTAVGDDGAAETASVYDVRRSAARILTEADFTAATPVPGEPSPSAAGAIEHFTVTGLSSDTPYHFAVKVLDEVMHASPVSNDASAVTAPPGGGGSPVPHLVISQIRVSGSSDDVVELYNPTAAPISLSGYSIQYLAANGNFGFRTNLTAANSVPARGWYLVAASGYSGSPTRDELLTGNMSNSAGHALLAAKITNVTGCSDPTIVDRVGYGAAAVCPEASPVTTPTGGNSVTRKPGGAAGSGQDTDDNSSDFAAPATPSFHNRFSTPANPPASLGNVRATLFLDEEPPGTRLTWAAAAGATAYHVFRGSTPDFMAAAPSPWLTTSTTTVVLFDPDTTWYYVVRATDGNEVSPD